MNTTKLNRMGFAYSFIIYIAAALLLYLQTHYVIPTLSQATNSEPILFWFIVGGLGVFVPLLVTSVFILKREGFKINMNTWRERMRFRKMTKRDWKWCLGGYLVAMALSGGMMLLMKQIFGDFKTSPSFMEFNPFSESGKYWMFLIWIPYWILNIMGEEILWRGTMLPRQELVFGKYSWLITGFGWTLFHLAFGWMLLPMLIPMLFVITFVAQKTKNSWNGVVIHALVNGPSFIAIALGVI